LKNFKTPFCKKNFGKFLKFPKLPKIKFYENFQLYGISHARSYLCDHLDDDHLGDVSIICDVSMVTSGDYFSTDIYV